MWLLCFIFTLTSASSQCSTYKCNTGYTKGECITESTGEDASIAYDQTLCYPEYVCTPSGSSTNCTLRQPSVNYPGEFCSTNSQCTSGSCDQATFVCKGLSVGQQCVNPYDCGPGMYCDSVKKVCTNQVKSGSACSQNNDYQCANGLICINLVCTSLFSVATGNQVDNDFVNDDTGFSTACTSGYAVYDEDNQFYTCTKAPHSENALPMKCTPGSKCVSSDLHSKNCTCGINQNGDSYCPLFEGDSYVQSMITSWKAIAQLNSGCNSYRRWGYQCFATQSIANQIQWYTWAANYTLYYNELYPLIQENQECTRQIETSSYWNIMAALSSSSASIQCPVYFCGTDKTNWGAEQCIFYEKDVLNYKVTDILSLNPCSTGTTCPTSQTSQNSTCTASTTQLSYAGDYCKKNEDCASGTCKNKVCSGAALAGACTNVQDCNPGLYCNTTTKVCDAQKVEGVNCASDYECLNNMTCNLGICIPYYSLPVGSVTNSVNSAGFSRACNFGFANLTTTTAPLKGICAKPPVSPSTGPIQCQPGAKCLDKTGTYSKICTCGLNEFGTAYCPSFEGDIYLKNSIIHMKTLMTKNKICNTESRFEERCFLRDLNNLETYYFYVTNFTMYLQLPALQENTECVKSIYTEDFWRWMKESYDHSAGIMATLASLLAIQVFI
ncbi:unnamed protein product [Blepharisma stoltei]|uniref:Uncharacterized protein n=1 Tax=Blepharisma stoltei TaxID=1481888 RepID=A0AAU9KIJ4_9CILI|nr:unnamed protein product [Blepharisma stoltei]